MRDDQLTEFSGLLDATCAMLSRGAYQPNPTSTALFFRSLGSYSLETVKTAMSKHIADPQRGRFVPTPADVIAQIHGNSDDGRPGPEEAWAIALRAQDEAETVVWSAEMAKAWGMAKVVLDAGDEVGARMTFRETYTRHVDAARSQRIAVRWEVSLGLDPARQAQALAAAAELGRTPHTEPSLALPPAQPAALLTGPTKGMSKAKAQAIEKLRKLGEKLAQPPGPEDYEPTTFHGAISLPTNDVLPPAMRRQEEFIHG